MNGNPYRDRDTAIPETLNPLHRPGETTLTPKGIVRHGVGAINGNLYSVTTMSRSQKGCHLIRNQDPIAEYCKSHPVLDNPFYKLREILAVKRLSSLDANIHNRAAIQFFEKLKPFFLEKILTYVPGTGKMGTVLAP